MDLPKRIANHVAYLEGKLTEELIPKPCPHAALEYELQRDLWKCAACGEPVVTSQRMPT